MARTSGLKIFTILFFLAASTSGQIKWEKFYGGKEYDFSKQLLELSDHNFLICGYTYSYGKGEADIWLIKVTPAGDTLWSKTYGGKSYECGTAACELPDGNLLVAGNTKSFAVDTNKAVFDVWLLKLKPNGDTLWTKTFPGSNSADARMVLDAQRNIYLAANSNQTEPNGDVQIIKCDGNGNRLWTKTYGKADYEYVNAFHKTADGSMLLLTTSQSFGAKTMWLFKLNSSGDTLWSRTYGSFSSGNASDIIEMPDGTFMMSGYAGSSASLVIYNLKPNGDVNWQKTYPQFTSNFTPTFRLLTSGNFFISAVEDKEVGRMIRLIRMNDTGAVLLSSLMGDSGAFNYGDDFLESSTGDFLMLGTTNKVTKTSDDIWLVSLTPDMYVDLGGELNYRLVQTADSLNHTYTLVRGPVAMTLSPGGTVRWNPPTSAPATEVVQVAIRSGAKIDTLGFLVNVNKRGNTAIKACGKAQKVGMTSAFTLKMTEARAIISSPLSTFAANVFTLQGKRLASLSGSNRSAAVWNLTDDAGKKVPNGKYFIKIISGSASVSVPVTIVR